MDDLPLRRPVADRAAPRAGTSTRGYVLYGPRSLRDPRRAGLVVVAVVDALAVCGVAVWLAMTDRLGNSGSLWYPLLALCTVVAAVALARGLRRPELLRIDHKGVSYGEVMVPWRSIYQLVILRHDSCGTAGASPQIGVRLNPGAPLPAGITALGPPPAGSSAVPDPLSTHITGARIDVEAALDAVHRFAPSDIVLVEQLGDEERVLRR
ncbi:MAG: hypothetical protein ACRDMV_09835 [Streptosporangiales bacterium]